MTNGANYKWGKLHHSPWHSDIRTSNQLNKEYVVLIPTKYKDPHGWADCVDGFIRVVKQTD